MGGREWEAGSGRQGVGGRQREGGHTKIQEVKKIGGIGVRWPPQICQEFGDQLSVGGWWLGKKTSTLCTFP